MEKFCENVTQTCYHYVCWKVLKVLLCKGPLQEICLMLKVRKEGIFV